MIRKHLPFALAAFFACVPLTEADKRAIAQDAIRIEVCKDLGRSCKDWDGGNCYAVYDACIVDAGLR